MCGFAGIVRGSSGVTGVDLRVLARMAAAVRHRGPDGYGFYAGPRAGLAHVRLSIIDLQTGDQPLANEDGGLLVVYNGEVYNYIELREDLRQRGHVFKTQSDTEVLVHGYEEWGTGLLPRLNGQFAFAIYDRRANRVFLARDRFGVRPLFYAERGGDFYFGSEAKALFASGEIEPEIDAVGLDQVFTFWAARPPRSVFRGVFMLEPGCWAVWDRSGLRTGRYYELDYPEEPDEAHDVLDRLDEILRGGVRLRLRADVPVGGYLSGGLDSTVTCSLAAVESPHQLRTFSVAFDDAAFDESAHQLVVAKDVGSRHAVQRISRCDIAEVFPQVVWHAETPIVRTAPAPLFLLSRLTRDHDIRVVLTGEGADELLLGYDLFKEVVVRLFCLRQPASECRPRLFDRLYPYLGGRGRSGAFWRQFFLSAGLPDDPLFSHLPRFLLTSRIKEFYADGLRGDLRGQDALEELRADLPPRFGAWSPVNRAAFLEMTTLLSPYLLASQGDRMALAHGVEGRFPYLDHRLFEFAAALPERSKLRGLCEKAVLRRWAALRLRTPIAARPKQPYRAPDVPAFFGEQPPEYVRGALSPAAVREIGLFEPRTVEALVRRCRSGQATGFRESQALVGVLSTQLWWSAFRRRPEAPGLPLPEANVLIRDSGGGLE